MRVVFRAWIVTGTFEKGRNDTDADEDAASDRKRSVRFA